jgi:hypothetical protein
MMGLRLGLNLGGARGGAVNLISNGDFSDGMTGWSDVSSAGGSATAPSGALLLNNATGTARAEQYITLTPGESYRATFTVSGEICAVYDSSAVSIGVVVLGLNEIDFTASASADRLALRNFTTGTVSTIDDISVVRV